MHETRWLDHQEQQDGRSANGVMSAKPSQSAARPQSALSKKPALSAVESTQLPRRRSISRGRETEPRKENESTSSEKSGSRKVRSAQGLGVRFAEPDDSGRDDADVMNGIGVSGNGPRGVNGLVAGGSETGFADGREVDALVNKGRELRSASLNGRIDGRNRAAEAESAVSGFGSEGDGRSRSAKDRASEEDWVREGYGGGLTESTWMEDGGKRSGSRVNGPSAASEAADVVSSGVNQWLVKGRGSQEEGRDREGAPETGSENGLERGLEEGRGLDRESERGLATEGTLRRGLENGLTRGLEQGRGLEKGLGSDSQGGEIVGLETELDRRLEAAEGEEGEEEEDAGALIEETMGAAGKVERVYASGKRVVVFGNGTKKEVRQAFSSYGLPFCLEGKGLEQYSCRNDDWLCDLLLLSRPSEAGLNLG
jgi:hypothetical protein